MSLPAEIFSEITDSIELVAEGEEAAGGGERRSSRVELRSHVALLPWNDPADEVSVRIRDLSSDGLGILHTKRMRLDDQFVVCFPLEKETVMGLYTIVYWEPLAEKLYAIGAHFDEMVTREQLAARMAMLTETPRESRGPLTRLGHALGRIRKAS